jgi:hypothetical protein
MLTEVCIANHNNKNTGNGNGNNKVAPVPPSNEAADPGTGSTENYVLTQPGPNLHRSSRNSNGNPNNMRSRSSKCKRMMDPQQPSLVTLKVPGTHFVRRTSGPFGDETLGRYGNIMKSLTDNKTHLQFSNPVSSYLFLSFCT